MNDKEVLIQALAATPNFELFQQSQSFTCDINSSSLVCILGQRNTMMNACMQMLAGISEPCSGTIKHLDSLLNANRHTNYSALRYIYHNSTLLSILNGIDNIRVPALYHHLGSEHDINKQLVRLLAELEYKADHTLLPAFMDKLQKRYLLIVRALMLNPSVLFIENPFMDLDREQVRGFGKYLAGLVKNKNMTVITSSVNLDFVQHYADQIIYLTSDDIQVFRERDTFSCYIKTIST